MDIQSINKIEQLVKDSMLLNVDGQTYTPASLKPVQYIPRPETLIVHNLRGFCGFIANDIDKLIAGNPHLIVVNDPESVDLISGVDPMDQKRITLVRAEINDGLKQFPFGKFLTQEEFAIAFRAMFIPGKKDDFEYVLSYASKLVGGTQIDGEDDGITQTVSIKRGLSGHLQEKATLKPIVKLTPYRTFREAEQPESEFLLRIRFDSNNVPTVALYEADGGAWINKATENVVNYIQSMIQGIPVIA